PGALSSTLKQKFYWETTVTPCRSTFVGRSCPPDSTTVFSTFSPASGSINKTTHPPPPAPHTLPPRAPLRRGVAIIRSMALGEIVGRIFERDCPFTFISRPGF